MTADELATALGTEAANELASALGRIKHCLDKLTDEQVWWLALPRNILTHRATSRLYRVLNTGLSIGLSLRVTSGCTLYGILSAYGEAISAAIRPLGTRRTAWLRAHAPKTLRGTNGLVRAR
jgi:hypothetical protein